MKISESTCRGGITGIFIGSIIASLANLYEVELYNISTPIIHLILYQYHLTEKIFYKKSAANKIVSTSIGFHLGYGLTNIFLNIRYT